MADSDHQELCGTKHLRSLNLANTEITDAGIRRLHGLSELTFLALDNTRISDVGMKHLEPLTNLIDLFLQGTPVGDNGLKHLIGLSHLAFLDLGGSNVTDAGMKDLEELKSLQWVDVSNTSKLPRKSCKNALRKVLSHCIDRAMATGIGAQSGDGEFDWRSQQVRSTLMGTDGDRTVTIIQNYQSGSSSSSSSSSGGGCSQSADANRTTNLAYAPDGQLGMLQAVNAATVNQTTTYNYRDDTGRFGHRHQPPAEFGGISRFH